MELSIYQVDAFSHRQFAGNPAAICPLEQWLPDQRLQAIAEENNLSETAFFVQEKHGYRVRWFTPTVEIDLCGHATLAAAYVIFEQLGHPDETLTFSSKSGPLHVHKTGEWLTLDFPATQFEACDTPTEILQAFDKCPIEVLRADDYLVIFPHENDIKSLTPDFRQLAQLETRGIITTAQGETCDFVSRFFAPRCGVDEDPVTGSAHCALTPYWSNVLGKARLTAKQLSKRGGELRCEMAGERVLISGQATLYLKGKIYF